MDNSLWKPMWTKSKEKRGVGRLHASNFGAGYVKIEEYHLMRTGLRGRKRWFFLCGAVFLMLIALGNLLLNCFLLAVLGFRPNGLPYMVLPSNNRVIFPQSFNTSQTNVTGLISSYENLFISSSASIMLSAGVQRTVQSSSGSRTLNSSQITLDGKSVKFKPSESQFSLYDRENHTVMSVNQSRTVFHPTNLLPILALDAITVTTPSVAAESLVGERVTLSSNEVLDIQLQDKVDIRSSKNIRITSGHPNGHFISESKDGIHLTDIPAYQSADSNHGNISTHYHLCICGNGKLFRVSISCSRANEVIDPCL